MTHWLAFLLIVALSATPLAGQDAPDATVRSVVTVDGALIEDEEVATEESGIAIDPLIRSPAEAARDEAERILELGELPSVFDEQIPEVTIVEVRSVVVARPNRKDAEACVQVGVVNAKQDCRPDRE